MYPAETKPRVYSIGSRAPAGEQDENGSHDILLAEASRLKRPALVALFAAWNPICPSDRGTAYGRPLRALTRIFGRFGRSQVDWFAQVSAS